MPRFSVQWLREWLDTELPAEELARRLTMAGVETEVAGPAARHFRGVLVAHVQTLEALEPGPGGAPLWWCVLEAGARGTPGVVSGAPGLRAGLRVPWAPPGTELPGRKAVTAREIAGRCSEGLLCSAALLGLDDREQLPVLPPDAPPGTEVWECLQLDDQVLELTPTPNRGDCFSVLGAARELAAVLELPLRAPPPVPAVPEQVSETRTVQLKDVRGCPRYAGRVLLDLDPAAESPAWLVEKLRRAGLRDLHPVVDVTNYVMLELGQPLHAFDHEHLHGAVQVRRAGPGESLCLLDGTAMRLQPEQLVIADERGVVALAGVMGGQDSAVGPGTCAVFLESAWFRPDSVAVSTRVPQLRTAAAQRFERGVDPKLQVHALQRATELLCRICGARPGPVVLEERPRYLPRRAPVTLRRRRLEALLGWAPSPKQVEDTLLRQDMSVEAMPAGGCEEWRVVPPGRRFDLHLEVDLVEEVARLLGYRHIPVAALRAGSSRPPSPDPSAATASRLAQRLCGRGYHEAVSCSLVDPGLQRQLFPDLEAPALTNPLARQASVLRVSTWPGLLTALRYNLYRQQQRVRLFECGVVFSAAPERPGEEVRLGGVACGPAHDEQWGEVARPLDFYDLKGDLERLLEDAGTTRFKAVRCPALHDGQAAAVDLEGERLGLLGRLHPALAAGLELPPDTWLFEVRLAPLAAGRQLRFQAPSRFPGLRRDLALVVPEELPAAALLDCVRGAGGESLAEVRLFDVYRGPELGENVKSLAIGLIFRRISSTLRQQEPEAALAGILEAARRQLGAVLRE